jgi:hypothetical protein
MMQEHHSKPATCASQPTHQACSMERRGTTLSLSNFKFEFIVLNDCKAGRAKSHACAQALDKGCLK